MDYLLGMARTPYAVRLRTRIADVEQQIARLQKELDELRVAERVILRLGGDETDTDRAQSRNFDVHSGRRGKATIASVVIETLQSTGPTDSHSLHAKLRDEWRSDLGFTTLSSTLSRMKRAGQIDADGRVWFLPNQHAETSTDSEKTEPKIGPIQHASVESEAEKQIGDPNPQRGSEPH